MRERLLGIIRKEFRQTFREPRMRSMLFLPPLVQLLVFGFAVNLDVHHATWLGWIGDHSHQSRELLAAFQGSGRFDVAARRRTIARSATCWIRTKWIWWFECCRASNGMQLGRSTAVQVLINGANSNTASIVSSYASSIISNFAAEATQ